MSGPKDPKGREALTDIEAALEGLLGRLGGTLSEMIGKLDAGEAGEVRRSATFDTGRGPVRAETGVRIRVGGLTTDGAKSAPAPVNRPDGRNGTVRAAAGRGAAEAGPVARAEAEPREAVFETYTADDRWSASADLPGVALDDVSLRVEDGQLRLETTGPRRYHGAVDLPPRSDGDAMETVLRNGILEVSLRLGRDGDE